MRFHVLGIGAIGTLVAQNLRLAQPAADVCLVVRNANLFRKPKNLDGPEDEYPREGPVLQVMRNGGDTIETRGYEIDVSRRGALPALRQVIADGLLKSINFDGPIESLIVCTKAPATVSAFEGLHHRILPSSVIALLQNGVGVYDELCQKFWPEPLSRPQFILGTTTHGVSHVDNGSVIHVTRPGEGAIKWGVVPDPRGFDVEQWLWGRTVSDLPSLTPPDSPRNPLPAPPPDRGLENLHATLEALLSMSALNPTVLPMPHLYHELLLKLAINATINPLTAILGGGFVMNGALIRSGPGRRLIQQTVAENSRLLSAYVETLSNTPQPDAVRLFSLTSLRNRINTVIHETSGNYSSMAIDVKRGQMTEIDYINGFLVSLGERLGIPTPINKMLVQMVKFKAELGGLGDTLHHTISAKIRNGEYESKEMRQLALDERRVSLMEREMLMRETRTTEAKRARRALKREVKQRERHDRWLAHQRGAKAAQDSASESESLGSLSDSEKGSTSANTSGGESDVESVESSKTKE